MDTDMDMLFTIQANIDHDGDDSEAVQAALALLQEATAPPSNETASMAETFRIEALSSRVGMNGMSGMSGFAAMLADSASSGQGEVAGLRDNDCDDLVQFIKLYEELPPTEILFQHLMGGVKAEILRAFEEIDGYCNHCASVQTRRYDEAASMPIEYAGQTKQRLEEGGDWYRGLDTLRNAEYDTAEAAQGDSHFILEQTLARSQLKAGDKDLTDKKARFGELAASSLKASNDIRDARDDINNAKLASGEQREYAWTERFMPRLHQGISSLQAVAEYCLAQAICLDKVILYIKVINVGTGMVSAKNRRTFITDGLMGATKKLAGLQSQGERLRSIIPDDFDEWEVRIQNRPRRIVEGGHSFVEAEPVNISPFIHPVPAPVIGIVPVPAAPVINVLKDVGNTIAGWFS